MQHDGQVGQRPYEMGYRAVHVLNNLLAGALGIALPPTGTHPRDYHGPLQDWLAAFELDTGKVFRFRTSEIVIIRVCTGIAAASTALG